MRIGSERCSPFSDKRLTIYAVFTLSALMGALFGALCRCSGIGSAGLTEMLNEAQENYFNVRKNGDVSALIISTLSGTGFYLLAAFLLGFSAIAQPFELILPFMRGMTCGVMITVSCGEQLSKPGIIRTAAVFPGVLAATVITVLASREALYLSDELFRVCFFKGLTEGLSERIKVYTVRFAGLAAATSVSALLDCVLAVLLL